MKRYRKTFIFFLLAMAPAFFSDTAKCRTLADPQPNISPQADTQEAEPEYSEEEYNAYDAATTETDYEKRATMLLAFIDKYPKSKLMPNIEYAYTKLLDDCQKEGKWELLEPLAEKWLKVHPNNLQTIAFIARAAENLGHDEKCAECLEEIYAKQPSGGLAYNILTIYRKIHNQAKVLEWFDKISKMPEYDGDFMLRYEFVQQYAKAQNFAKAAEYARLTLKSAEQAKQVGEQTKEQLVAVRHSCYHLIGMNQYQADKFPEAAKSFQQAISYGKYSEGYYYLGMCQWNLRDVDNALISFAKAELLGGDVKDKAKSQLETLYKSQHNNLTIGIEKIYRKAKAQLEIEK